MRLVVDASVAVKSREIREAYELVRAARKG